MEREPTGAVAAPNAQAAQAHYDRGAGLYGRSRLLPSLQKRALAELRPEPGDRLLDVASGADGVAPDVQRAVGVDLSEGMLQIARSRLREAAATRPLDNVEFLQGPSDALPFEDGSLTALVCTTAFHHFPDPQRSIDEIARVPAPGGRLVLGDAARDRPWTKLAHRLYRRSRKGTLDSSAGATSKRC